MRKEADLATSSWRGPGTKEAKTITNRSMNKISGISTGSSRKLRVKNELRSNYSAQKFDEMIRTFTDGHF